jgi:hypothetical protein
MKENAMHIAMILDRSGSMSSIQEATVEGVNAFLAEQRQSTAEVSLLLVQFDDQYEKVFSGPIAAAPFLTLSENPASNQVRFQPRGMTALLDAMGRTMDEVGKSLAALAEDQRPAKVVIVTMTDGAENSSKHFTLHQIANKIQQQRDVYKWEFQFLAANQDAIATAAAMNIPMGNAITYTASAQGARNVIAAIGRNLTSYARPGAPMPMFSGLDRAAAVEQEPEEAKP